MPYVPLFVGLFLLGGLCSCDAERPHNDHTELYLKGWVKELYTKRYKALHKDGKIVKGRPISRNLDGDLLYEYEGLPTNSKAVFDAQQIMTDLYTYDRNNRLEQRIEMMDTLFKMYTADGTYFAKIVLDDRWLPHRMDVYYASGELLEHTAMTYEYKNGQPYKHIYKEYNAEGALNATTHYEYDAQQRPIVVDRRVEGLSHHRQQKERKVESITYDANSHPIKVSIEEAGNNQTIDIEYLLDEQGNWVQATERIDGHPHRIIERKIVYY